MKTDKAVLVVDPAAGALSGVMEELDELGFRVVDQPNVAARERPVAIARRHQKIDVQRPVDLAHQVAEKDKASLQQPQD